MKTTDRVSANMRLLKDVYGYTNQTIAELIGRPGITGRDWVQERVSGARPIGLDALGDFAEAFDIPTPLLLAEPAAIMQHVAEHRPDLLERHSRWNDVYAGQEAALATR